VENLESEQFTWTTPPSPADSRHITLQLSWDRQNWQTILPTGRNYTFEYYEAPEVSAIMPHFGPVKNPNNETVIISGTNFICPKDDCSQVTVRFGHDDALIYMPGIVVDNQHIKCSVPKYTKPDVLPVEISLDGNDYTNNGITYGFFDAYLLEVHPRLISKLGGTPITLSGFGFVNAGEGETKSKYGIKGGELNCTTFSPCI
jgi:hypothetical protein